MTYEEAKMQIQAIPEKIWNQLSEPDREAMEMAFSALQEQDSPKPTAESVQNVQNEDLISRKAAIDAALSAFSRGLLASPAIRKLPSAQPEPQWIPVSERLSEAEVLCCDIRGEMIIGYPYQDDESNTGYSAVSDDVYMIGCIAWMPLPEPYRAERRTDDANDIT